MPLARGAIAIAVIGLGFAAIAQQFGEDKRPAAGTETPAPATGGPQQPIGPQVDESALRYFASQGDTRRVDAEIARLRALYPNWTPPGDLSQLSSGPVVARDPLLDQLWTFYTEDRLAEARAAIAERQASDPQWKPPQDLTTALETAEARRRLVNASDNAQWRTVLSVATETPSLLTCASVDVLWRVAEAFAKTDQPNRTTDVYTYLLTNCTNPAERLGTLQKALTLLPEQRVGELLKFERKGPDDPDNFSAIRDELARRRVERASGDGKLTASAEDLAAVERLAEGSTAPGNALLIGWYSYHHANPDKALQWFKTALDRDGGPKAAEGYALTLRALNRLGEAEAFAYEWRDRSADNLRAYLDIATALLSQDPPPRLEPAVVARIVPVVNQQRFAAGAQALGWYAYNTGQVSTARAWFRTALSWKADDEPSAYGLALATQRLNDRAGFSAIVTQWGARSSRIAGLAAGRGRGQSTTSVVPEAPQAIAAAPIAPVAIASPRPISAPVEAASERAYAPVLQSVAQARTRPGARRTCTMTRDPGNLQPDAALTLGWCLMEINRPLEAVAAFDQALRTGSARTREEAAYGKSLAYLRKDLTSQAAIAAAEAPQTAERRVELQASILAQRALAAYRAGRYTETILALSERDRIVPAQTDLMLIKGWSYFKLGRYGDAEMVFRAVHRTGYSDEASIGLNAVQEAVRPSRQY